MNLEVHIKQIVLDTLQPEMEKMRRELLEGTALMTIKETARKFGVSERSIHKWMRREKNPLIPIRLGDLVRFREIDVIEWARKSGEKMVESV